MRVYETYAYTGREQHWKVPKGVTEATFECWGAAGGMPSWLHYHHKVGQTAGGSGPANIYFTNSPERESQLGVSYPNNAGYALGVKPVTEGETYHVFVGGNGGPGYSTIRETKSGHYQIGLRGGAAGYNGGGQGGKGAHVFRNLYNSSSTKVQYRRRTIPPAAKIGQRWYDTNGHVVYKCTSTYHQGAASMTKWEKVSNDHPHSVGPSGGGGGGATDIRTGGDDLNDRILVAGGGGGAGGHFTKTGGTRWTLESNSTDGPLGTDTLGTGPHGADHTWATLLNFIRVGFGHGGMGGGTSDKPSSLPTTDGGRATAGQGGGWGIARHAEGTQVPPAHGSNGGGGGAVAGGHRGVGGGHAGSLGTGGDGGDASGGYDDWTAGGGGGGGGFYGGGGGGQGFMEVGRSHVQLCRGGGGGGGSNYAANVFTHTVLAGGARPPAAAAGYGTGANGRGGFARISYHQPPEVQWIDAPNSASGDYDVEFKFIPAQDGGQIAYFVIGTGSSTDTFPTSQTTYTVADKAQTFFTAQFSAPAVGAENAIFVKVVDTDGDGSAWLKQTVRGIAPADTTPVTITSPAAGAQFETSATVGWTPGDQTPEAAYRVFLTGDDLVTGKSLVAADSGWLSGGSRVNLALDPGFVTVAEWTVTGGAISSVGTNPGASGRAGLIEWDQTDDGSDIAQAGPWDNLVPGQTYRVHLEVACPYANDTRDLTLAVADDSGVLNSAVFAFESVPANTLVPLDLEFTPKDQNVTISVAPSAANVDTDSDLDPLFSADFEDGVDGFVDGTASQSQAQVNGGDYSLAVTAATTQDITALLVNGAGWYSLAGSAYSPAAAASGPSLSVVAGSATFDATDTTRDAWVFLRTPFYWDGTGTVVLSLAGDAATEYYDDIEVRPVDLSGSGPVGSADSNEAHYLANFMLELSTPDGETTYGDGDTAGWAWAATAHDSESVYTGSDVTSYDLTYAGVPLNAGNLTVVTLSTDSVIAGYGGAAAIQDIKINPSLPTEPTVTLTVDSNSGSVLLDIDAADGAAGFKTTTFDIFRDGVRIVTGLRPDTTTRACSYRDWPTTDEQHTYKVRAFDQQGGYVDAV